VPVLALIKPFYFGIEQWDCLIGFALPEMASLPSVFYRALGKEPLCRVPREKNSAITRQRILCRVFFFTLGKEFQVFFLTLG